MKTIISIYFLILSLVCFGQQKATLEDGSKIIVYSDKTWKYESELQTQKIDTTAIYVNLKDDAISCDVWKLPFAFYSICLKDFPREKVQLIGYSKDDFLVKSINGQVGYVSSLCIENSDKYAGLLQERIIQKAQSEKKKILINGIGVYDINSAGGVSIFIDYGYFDYSKVIKYISFTVVPYNNVGDIQTCSISGKSSANCTITGPIAASESFNPPNNELACRWENVWYNTTITCIKLTKLTVQYMDGTGYVYINELPKIMANQYINKCK